MKLPDNLITSELNACENPAEELGLAILVAAENHFGQFDRGGHPYILHCLKVMHYVKTDDKQVQAIAVLHDVIEDCFDGRHEEGYIYLKNLGFSERVINGVRALTKLPGQSPEEYLSQIKKNWDAIQVKLADLRHNSDLRRLKGITQKDINRQAKYMSMYKELSEYWKGVLAC